MGPWGGRRWVICVCTRWITWAMPGSREDLAAPPESPPSLHAGRDFSKEQQGRCQIQKEFAPNSLEIPAYGFFFFFSPPSFFLGREDLQGAWPQPASPGALPPRTASQRQEFSQEIPLSSPLLPPPPRKQKAAIRNPLSI